MGEEVVAAVDGLCERLAPYRLRPADVDVLFALATYYLQAGNNAAALEFAHKLQALQPDNAQVRALLEQIRAQ